MQTQGVFLAGVGGQGIILSARIIAQTARLSGLDVTGSEIHGMAQRGGSVTAQVRFGERVGSPLILEGEAIALLAMEKMESLRYAHYLKPEALAVISSQIIVPVTVSSGRAVIPADLDARIVRVFPQRIVFDPAAEAEKLGSTRLSNTLMLGALASALPFEDAHWHQAIIQSVKPDWVDRNIAAFNAGKQLRRHV